MNKKQGKALSKMILLGIPLAIVITIVVLAFVWLGLVGLPLANGQESGNTTQQIQIQKDGIKIYDTDYCQKNLTATAQRVCGKTDLLCQEHKGESEFWDGICKTLPEELDKIK